MEKFVRYTHSWQRPASAPGAPVFRPWSTDAPPPSHSIPPNVAVKAAARQGAFEAYHLALMRAYFEQNRCVTDRATIAAVAGECGLDVPAFLADLDDPALEAEVVADHTEAVEAGVTGVPCVIVNDVFPLPGAQDANVYEQIVAKVIERGLNRSPA